MARRYVPKTYNNKRILRLISTAIITLALSFVILFLILFFVFQRYVVDGQLQIPWELEEEYEAPEDEQGVDDIGVGSETESEETDEDIGVGSETDD